MKNKNILILFACLISLFFVLQPVFAINASSSNYSVGRFATGLATSNASSANYQAISLTESAGTTRNAESDSFITNIGFFSDTHYYRTVSISSYSVYPRTAYAVASIRLYISALNYQSIWANITRPDSVVERVELTNNDYEYYTAGILGRYNITFYANSSDGALSSVIDHFYVIEYTGGGGGGSSGGDEEEEEEEEQEPIIIPEPCTYIWDCTPWGVCSDGKQTRECKNIGDCNGSENKPIETMNCSQSLFDILINLQNINISEDNTILFGVNLTEMMGVEKIDVSIKYSVINEEGYEIFSQIETKAVEGNLSYNKELSDLKMQDGDYILRVDALYGNLQRAFAEQKFSVINGEIVFGDREKKVGESFFNKFDSRLILMVLGLIMILVLMALILLSVRKNSKEKGEEAIEQRLKEGWKALDQGNVDEARKKYRDIKFIYKLIDHTNDRIYNKAMKFYKVVNRISFFGIILLFPLLFAPNVLKKLGITGNFIGTNPGEVSLMFILTLSLFILFIIIFSVGQIGKFLQVKTNEDTISNLISKQVYSSNGYIIGKVKEVILENNRINSLIITLNEKYNSSNKGIIVDYSNVKSIKSVVILDDKVKTNLF